MRDYKNIKAYKLADQLVVEIYKGTKNFPKEETYGLVSQIRRAAISAPANIAEGASRQHNRDYLNFLYNSRGSLAEVEYLLELSRKLGFLEDKELKKLRHMKEEAAKTLYGLIRSVERESRIKQTVVREGL